MPLPKPPDTRFHRPDNRLNRKADNDLMIKAILCCLIGLGVLITPHFIAAPGIKDVLTRSTWVGCFALALGIGFAIVYLRRKRSSGANPE